MLKACAVFVVCISAFPGFVIAITVTVKSAHIVAGGCLICGRSTGVTLPANAVCAAVVLVVVTETVLEVTSNVLAGVAG